MSDTRVETKRKIYTILNLMSDMGGMVKVVFGLLSIIGTYINA
jgi:hypothetical protein